MEKLITALKLIAIQLERANELKELELSNQFKTDLENKFFETKRNKMLKELNNGKTMS